MLTTATHPLTSTDTAAMATAGLLADLDLMAPHLAAELAAPRNLAEDAEAAAARRAALDDITADLLAEAAENRAFTAEEIATGGGDPWSDTDPDDDVPDWGWAA